MTNFLGIDIGGNQIQLATVSENGIVRRVQRFSTQQMREVSNFIPNLINIIEMYVEEHKIAAIGVSIPGFMSQDRHTPLDVVGIPELNGQPLHQMLWDVFPQFPIFLENEANAMALAEHHYAMENAAKNFILISLGTTIGSAAILDGKLFKGGNGNAVQLGDIVLKNKERLEHIVGHNGLLELFDFHVKAYEGDKPYVKKYLSLNPDLLLNAAASGDEFSLHLFNEIGEILGDTLASVIRILDITVIFVGGSLAACFPYLKNGIMNTLYDSLSPYYLERLSLQQAFLVKNTGILGAAALCYQK